MWPEKNGKTYRIRDEINGHKVTIESGFETKTAARNRITILKSEKLRGKFVNPRDGEITLNDWLDVWWPVYRTRYKPSSEQSEGRRLRRHIRPLLGEFKLNEIDGLVIAAWVATLLEPDEDLDDRRPLKPKSVRNCHGLLYSAMQAAVGKRINANPCAGTGLPEVAHREMRFLDEAETGRLLAALPRHWRPLALLLVSTGLRFGEAIGLRIGRLDVLGCKLRVERTLQELADTAELVEVTPKSKKSRRSVTFPTDVAQVLAGVVAGRDRSEYVFTAVKGGPVRYRVFWRTWTKAVADAGLDGLRIHDLRHTHAASLIARNIPLTGIQHRLGHSSITVTSDLYGHLLPVVDENIIAAVEDALSMVNFRGILGGSGAEPSGDGRSPTEVTAGQAA